MTVGCRGMGSGEAPIYSPHSWASSSPWAQSCWKSQACPSWRTVPFQQVKELCKAILDPGDVPGEHTETHARSVWVAPSGEQHSALPFTCPGLTETPALPCAQGYRQEAGKKSKP